MGQYIYIVCTSLVVGFRSSVYRGGSSRGNTSRMVVRGLSFPGWSFLCYLTSKYERGNVYGIRCFITETVNHNHYIQPS